MVDVFPFRALAFQPLAVGSLTRVTSQPYDKIDEGLQRTYYERHPKHIVRIVRGRDRAEDNEVANKYTRARDLLEEWLRDGTFLQREQPAFYSYRQVYQAGGGRKIRKGLTAMVRIEEPGKGSILPHEQTHIGPKIDRFKLLNATMTWFEHVFLLYSDPDRKVNACLDRFSTGSPALASQDDLGETHEAWPVEDAAAIESIQEALRGCSCIIADGHHRYETSYKFMLDMKKAGAKAEGAETYTNVLATLVNMDDEGLTLFPTHRVVDRCDDFEGLRRRLGEEFAVRALPAKGDAVDRALKEAKNPAFGIVGQEGQEYYVAELRDPARAVERIPGPQSREWKMLDVNVLHGLILHPLVGVTPDDLAHERRVAYLRHTAEVIDAVRVQKRFQLGLLVRPCTIGQIQAITRLGERFPQKTTDFYPKLLSGFIMCRLNVNRTGLDKLKG
jgi:uncharacterized protein (DUF1015 family)